MPIGDKSYTVEINDSEFEREGWKRGRYKGTKLTATKINEFIEGDISYGREPLIEQFSRTVYVFIQANNSFEANAGIFYPDTDEFGQTLPDKSIIGSTNFKLDRAVTFNIDDPTDFSSTEPGVNFKDPSFNFFDELVKTDLALFNSCSVRFFDNTNNGFVKSSYIVGYNRGEFKPAAAYFQSASTATNVGATINESLFDYELSDNGRLYINPNVEDWFIAQTGASGSQGSLTLGNTAITLKHSGDENSVNSGNGYFIKLSQRLKRGRDMYYISFNNGLGGLGTLNQKNLIKAFDIHELEETGSNQIDVGNNTFSIKTTGRYSQNFLDTYDGANKEEFILFREKKSNNNIHLDFNLVSEAPAGVGDGGVIIPSNLHPKIKESLNTYLSNAGLGAQGGTGGNFSLGGVTAETQEPTSTLQKIQRPSNVAVQSGATLDANQKPSDIRLKENIIYLKQSPTGIPIYKFNYIGKSGTYIGTMAQDLLKLGLNKAVVKNPNGYYSVYYNMIDVDMKKIS